MPLVGQSGPLILTGSFMVIIHMLGRTICLQPYQTLSLQVQVNIGLLSPSVALVLQ